MRWFSGVFGCLLSATGGKKWGRGQWAKQSSFSTNHGILFLHFCDMKGIFGHWKVEIWRHQLNNLTIPQLDRYQQLFVDLMKVAVLQWLLLSGILHHPHNLEANPRQLKRLQSHSISSHYFSHHLSEQALSVIFMGGANGTCQPWMEFSIRGLCFSFAQTVD